MLYHLSLMDIGHRPPFPADSGLYAGVPESSGDQLSGSKGDLRMLLGGTGVGAVFLLVSRMTGEGVGYGDSWLILILGIYLGMWKLLEVLAGTCLLLAVTSVICLTVKRMSRRCTLPFVPFLAAGYLLSGCIF